MDEAKLDAFINQALGELGAAMNAALVVIGDKLGLYKAMAGAGPMTSIATGRASPPASMARPKPSAAASYVPMSRIRCVPRAPRVVPLVRNVTAASAGGNVATRVSLNASVGTGGASSARTSVVGSTLRARHSRAYPSEHAA